MSTFQPGAYSLTELIYKLPQGEITGATALVETSLELEIDASEISTFVS